MSLDYKVRIEGRQYGHPAVVTMFSIDGRIRSIKGWQRDETTSLYLKYDVNDKKLMRVEGHQFGGETDLWFTYTKREEREIEDGQETNVTNIWIGNWIKEIVGKRGGKKVKIGLEYNGYEITHIYDFKSKAWLKIGYNPVIRNDNHKIEIIKGNLNGRGISNGFRGQQIYYKGNRIVEVDELVTDQTLTLTYELIFNNQTPYRNNANRELPPEVEVDTETIINSFLFLL